MQPDIFPTGQIPVLCWYQVVCGGVDQTWTENGTTVIHVVRSNDILDEFDFHMRHMEKSGAFSRYHYKPRNWKLTQYLPKHGEAHF